MTEKLTLEQRMALQQCAEVAGLGLPETWPEAMTARAIAKLQYPAHAGFLTPDNRDEKNRIMKEMLVFEGLVLSAIQSKELLSLIEEQQTKRSHLAGA